MSATVNTQGSIERRLLFQLLGSAAVLAIALFFVVQAVSRQQVEASQNNILAASATSILDASAILQGELVLDLPYSAFSMLGNISDDRVYYAIKQDGQFLTGYEDLPAETSASPLEPQFSTLIYKGQEIRLAAVSRRLAIGEQLTTLDVYVGQTRNGQREALRQMSQTAALVGFGFFLCAAFLGTVSAQSALRPIERLTDSIRRRGPSDLRPVAAPVPREMADLVRALNSFMDRLQASLSQSEEFIAEAAHRVRTPLATVRAQAEITLRRVEKDENRASMREMIRAIDESSRAAGQMLDHAMVTFRSDHLEREDIDLGELAHDMIDRLRPLADLRDISLSCVAPANLHMRGDRILIQSALRNLLDNAIKYAPIDSDIDLIVKDHGEDITLTIQDQGQGFPDLDIQKLTRRFARGSNTVGIVGSGLGLTIVAEVTSAHGGQLTISNSTEGPGACVTLSFPSA